jgi:hypothetical protein
MKMTTAADKRTIVGISTTGIISRSTVCNQRTLRSVVVLCYHHLTQQQIFYLYRVSLINGIKMIQVVEEAKRSIF